MRRQKSFRIGVHHANAVVWEPVCRTRRVAEDDRPAAAGFFATSDVKHRAHDVDGALDEELPTNAVDDVVPGHDPHARVDDLRRGELHRGQREQHVLRRPSDVQRLGVLRANDAEQFAEQPRVVVGDREHRPD
eukprot:11427-Pelagococcus_subviridis.AAC.1